jgi:hypothetical protein
LDNRFLDANQPICSGKTLAITATGNVKEKIEKGAKMHLQVKYGLITLINQEVDLCEQSDKVNIECPVDKGTLTVVKDVELPKEIPPVSHCGDGHASARAWDSC